MRSTASPPFVVARWAFLGRLRTPQDRGCTRELFEWDADFNDFSHVILQLPPRWTVTDETGTADRRDLARVQLVACQTIATTSTGKARRFQKGGTEVLDLLVAHDRLTVFEAATGEKVASLRLRPPRPKCPMFVDVRRRRHDSRA